MEVAMKTLLISVLATFLLAGCAAPAGNQLTVDESLELQGLVRGEGDVRIPSYRITGWNQVNDRNLVVTVGVNDKYLVELRGPCPELEYAFSIGFTITPINRLDRFGDIILRGPGGSREYCPIANVWALEAF